MDLSNSPPWPPWHQKESVAQTDEPIYLDRLVVMVQVLSSYSGRMIGNWPATRLPHPAGVRVRGGGQTKAAARL